MEMSGARAVVTAARRPPPNTNDILHTISTTFFTEQDANTLHLHGIIESTHTEQHSQHKLITCVFTAETSNSDDKSKWFKALWWNLKTDNMDRKIAYNYQYYK